MSEPRDFQWAAFPKSTKLLIWINSVLVGALLGLILFTRQSYSIWGFLACSVLPFLGSDLLVYGKMRPWKRAKDERAQAVFLLTCFGFLLSIAIVGAIGQYALGWSEMLGPKYLFGR